MGGRTLETRAVDVAVIGAGTAGLNARREAARRGARVVLIESGPYGTMCARVGCMPSKLLIAAADVAHEVEGAGLFGIELVDKPRILGPAVLDRVRRERPLKSLAIGRDAIIDLRGIQLVALEHGVGAFGQKPGLLCHKLVRDCRGSRECGQSRPVCA